MRNQQGESLFQSLVFHFQIQTLVLVTALSSHYLSVALTALGAMRWEARVVCQILELIWGIILIVKMGRHLWSELY